MISCKFTDFDQSVKLIRVVLFKLRHFCQKRYFESFNTEAFANINVIFSRWVRIKLMNMYKDNENEMVKSFLTALWDRFLFLKQQSIALHVE